MEQYDIDNSIIYSPCPFTTIFVLPSTYSLLIELAPKLADHFCILAPVNL